MPDFSVYSKNYSRINQGLSVTQNTGLDSTVTISAPSQVNSGSSFQITGTVSGSAATPTGTVTIQKLSGTTWSDVKSGTLSSGSYIITGLTETTATTYRAYYLGDSVYGRKPSSTTPTVKCWGQITYTMGSTGPVKGTTSYLSAKESYVYTGIYNWQSGLANYTGVTTNPTYIEQGYRSSNGYQTGTMMTFSYSTLATYLDSSCSVTKVELYLDAGGNGWDTSTGGTAVIWYNFFVNGQSVTNGGLPTSTVVNAYDYLIYLGYSQARSWTSGTGAKWLDITSLTDYGFSTTGTNTIWHYGYASGITLVRNSTSNIYHGYFYPASNSTYGPKLRITFTKYGYV
jgi:hypothetical protein